MGMGGSGRASSNYKGQYKAIWGDDGTIFSSGGYTNLCVKIQSYATKIKYFTVNFKKSNK